MFSPEALQHLYRYMDDIHARERDIYHKKDLTQTELRLGNMASITEECGELSSAVRGLEGLCYSKKRAENATQEAVILEAMDVLICTMLLMKKYEGGNLDTFLYEKIGKNQDRGY